MNDTQAPPVDAAASCSGVELIAAERRRQIEKEGWTADHDEMHGGHQLALAAVCYALPPHARLFRAFSDAPHLWPWEEEWWKPADRIKELAKAGALIAAEIDRITKQRADTAAKHGWSQNETSAATGSERKDHE